MSKLNSSLGIPPTPSLVRKHHGRVSPWLDEQIWGHRIRDGQDPWLLFLEFLNIAEACSREGKLFSEDARTYPLIYRPYQRITLRNILYNNEELERIADSYQGDEAWEKWISWMKQHAKGIAAEEFDFLRERFQSFDQFATFVQMLRSTTVESDSNKRWSSRFVFPFGPNAMYEDLNIRGPSSGREYNNFTRAGELMYLMLSRSSLRDDLRGKLHDEFSRDGPWNRLLGMMQPDGEEPGDEKGRSYLPYDKHFAFDHLANDWHSLFSRRLPEYDVYPHLSRMASFHLQLYQLDVASELIEQDRPYFVCEIVAPRKTYVREVSWNNFIENDTLSTRAIEVYLNHITEMDEWKEALDGANPFDDCRSILEETVGWGESYNGPRNPTDLMIVLREQAIQRHQAHAAKVHRSFGRYVGLISSRGTTRLRYAPNDSLLATLVLANVAKRKELGAFVRDLFTKYRIVIGDREAEEILPRRTFDKKAFRANLRRLEERLISLGLLNRLSDGCAYVENRYASSR